MNKKRKDEVILSIRDLVVIFKGNKILDKFDLDVNKGEVHALFGEKGSGKTTLAKTISGIIKKTSGDITVEGAKKDIRNTRDAFRTKLSFVHQKLAIYPNLSVRDNLFITQDLFFNFGIINNRKVIRKLESTPNVLELDLDLETPVGKLSYIQKWKMVINRALLRNSKIIIMDDVASGLGLEETNELFSCFAQLKNIGMTILYLTSRMQEVLEVADRVTIMKSGKKIGTTVVKEKDSWNVFKMMVGNKVNIKPPTQNTENKKNNQKNQLDHDNFHEEYYQTLSDEQLQNIQFERIIGESKAIKRVLAQVIQIAKSGANVLILGETGVGKELIAEAIHYNSLRIENPFIPVHCSTFPESLLPSELFGHEKGAFTGANERRIGRFELANKGSLFLDEIGELNLDIQVRLLRVLQTKEFERVGGIETVKSDFRLITATNRNLEKEVEEKRFRQDLFFRLNVIPIYVPALKDRKEDIPLLVSHFLNIYSKLLGKVIKGFSKVDMERLISHDWPGNVRELQNVIERAVTMSQGEIVKLYFSKSALTKPSKPEPSFVPQSMKEMEKKHIVSTLEQTKWKISGPGGASELLEMHEATLRSRMKKYSIQKPK
ncbi:MAG: sigma 54-interacting transcriptional regulator [Deltaproteobacteria bacterium]|jgi:transcriptional regulator with GAF, ATPase, and Fis domain/predicted ATPase|nr:sigma 54-interacting transcriptional regulator [Deltaproteobacteria bacterium]